MDLLETLLAKIPDGRPQRQDSTNAQHVVVESFLTANDGQTLSLLDRVHVANQLGMYDAADLYKVQAARNQ